MSIKLEATPLRTCWAVRPEGQLGTCGWHPFPWAVAYVEARNAEEAVNKVKHHFKAPEPRRALAPAQAEDYDIACGG